MNLLEALLLVGSMTRIEEFTTNKTRRRSHFHIARQHNGQPTSMRRQLVRRIPSIVLLLVSCLVFVVLLTLEYGNCSQVLVDGGGNNNNNNNNRKPSHATRIMNSVWRPAHSYGHRHGTRMHQHAFAHTSGPANGDKFVNPAGGGSGPEFQFLDENRRASSRSIIGSGGSEISVSSSGSESSGSSRIDSGSGSGSESSNQQVPQQALPIVVSSSDNSYVSASPIESPHQPQPKAPPTSDRSRPDVAAHYNIGRATIIKTRESIQMGATFINYTLVSGLNACLVECWITDNCDTAIYQEEPVDFSNHLPYLQINNNNNNINNKIKRQLKINHNIVPGSDHHHRRHHHHHQHQPSSPSISLSSLMGAEDDNRIPLVPENDGLGMIEREDDDLDVDDDDGDDDDENDDDLDLNTSEGDGEDINNIIIDSSRIKSPKLARIDAEENEEEEEVIPINDNVNNNNKDQQAIPEMGSIYICYLFQCAKPDGFKCQFSAHNYYVSSIGKRKLPSSLHAQLEQQTPSSVNHKSYNHHRRSHPHHHNHRDLDENNNEIELQLDADSRPLVASVNREPHYSNLINGQHHPSQNHHHQLQPNDWFTGGSGSRWGGGALPHVASIKIGQEEDYARYDRGGLNGAIIALMFGVCATGILIMIVGHKMKTIRQKIAYKGRRRSLVPDAEFLINTMPI